MEAPGRVALGVLAWRFSWRDPEGNIWDVAFAKGMSFDEHGGMRFR